jgi:cytochrome c-type biogenesis protein CcmF
LRSGGLFAPVSREGALIVNNLFLATAVMAVLVGPLYPLVLQAISGALISVGAPFFDLTFGALIVPLLIIIPFGPFLAWKRGDLIGVTQRLAGAAALTLLLGIISVIVAGGNISLATLGLLLGIWVVVGSVAEIVDRSRFGHIEFSQSWRRLKGLPKNAWSTMLAHFGVGICVLGVVSVSAWETERVDNMSQGQTIELAGYQVKMLDLERRREDNFIAEKVNFEITSPLGWVSETASEKRVYTASNQPSTEAAILTYGFSQLYISLGDVNEQGTRVVRIWHKPFITLIWFGFLIMAGAGFLSLSDRKLRIGMPKAARHKPSGSKAELAP